jgi:hypothetical protein
MLFGGRVMDGLEGLQRRFFDGVTPNLLSRDYGIALISRMNSNVTSSP